MKKLTLAAFAVAMVAGVAASAHVSLEREGDQNLRYYFGGPCPCPVAAKPACPPEPCPVTCPPAPCPPPVEICCPDFRGWFDGYCCPQTPMHRVTVPAPCPCPCS